MDKENPGRNYLNLIIGVAFLGYGGYRLFTFYLGAPYDTFRIIVDTALVLLGIWDIYQFFKKRDKKKGP